MNESVSTTTQAVPALTVEDAEVWYDELQAVRQVSFMVNQGELLVLIGANGAGKSSLLRSIIGLEAMKEGRLELNGTSLTGLPSYRRAGLGLGYLPEGRGVFPSLTVEENLLATLAERKRQPEVLERGYTLFPNLRDRRGQIAGSMSGGEQQMLALCRSLTNDPSVLMLDELSLGLAPSIVAGLFEQVAMLRDSGLAVILVEQFAHAALRVADRAGVMVLGRLVRIGPASDLSGLSPGELANQYFNVDGGES